MLAVTWCYSWCFVRHVCLYEFRNVLRLTKDGEGTCLDCEWGTCLFGGGRGAVCLHTKKKNINELTRCEEWTKRK